MKCVHLCMEMGAGVYNYVCLYIRIMYDGNSHAGKCCVHVCMLVCGGEGGA